MTDDSNKEKKAPLTSHIGVWLTIGYLAGIVAVSITKIPAWGYATTLAGLVVGIIFNVMSNKGQIIKDVAESNQKYNQHKKTPSDRYILITSDQRKLLIAMMRHLAGNSHISFEGNLSKCVFPELLNPSSQVTEVLKRNTLFPRAGFVVLPLTSETIQPILDVVLPANRFLSDIYHIQIEMDGRLEFGTYDNFYDGCVICSSDFPLEFLGELKETGAIKSWQLLHQG